MPLERLRVLRVIPRTGGELPEPHPAQLAPERLPAERDLECVPQPAHEVAKPPAHDAMKLGLRSVLDGLRERSAPFLALVAFREMLPDAYGAGSD